jgi:hypothetical protein
MMSQITNSTSKNPKLNVQVADPAETANSNSPPVEGAPLVRIYDEIFPDKLFLDGGVEAQDEKAKRKEEKRERKKERKERKERKEKEASSETPTPVVTDVHNMDIDMECVYGHLIKSSRI